MRTRVLAALILPALLALSACGSDESSDEPDASASAGQCQYPSDGNPSKEGIEAPPAEPTSSDGLTIATNRGDIKVTFDAANAPCTVNSFVSLAEQGYFDDTKCHRVVPNFVLQCGDPTATGTGGPGYSFADELSGDETYPAGTLAMANAGPDTNGSQFFIVLEGGEQALTPDYTVFGKVDAAGLKVAEAIAKDGTGPDGVAPAKDVVIESVS